MSKTVLCFAIQLPNKRMIINVTAAINDAMIAPLLCVSARPKKIKEAVIPQVTSQRGRRPVDLRFLSFSKNKAIAAKDASNIKEPAELPVVKKPLTSFE